MNEDIKTPEETVAAPVEQPVAEPAAETETPKVEDSTSPDAEKAPAEGGNDGDDIDNEPGMPTGEAVAA